MNIIHILSGRKTESASAYSVASYEDATEKGSNCRSGSRSRVVCWFLGWRCQLFFQHAPSLLGGMKVLGLGQVKVQGAILVNNKWGGMDESGNAAGLVSGPPYAVSCMPLLNLSKLLAKDIRVVGGVDNKNNYGNVASGQSSPLRANKLSVPDPYKTLPVPTTAVDPVNVKANYYGARNILTLPFVTTTLQPGVYDYINIIAGRVVFQPGVYVIRSQEPITKLALSFLAGQVVAEGVMFYITDTATYNVAGANPDANDAENESGAPFVPTLIPSGLLIWVCLAVRIRRSIRQVVRLME